MSPILSPISAQSQPNLNPISTQSQPNLSPISTEYSPQARDALRRLRGPAEADSAGEISEIREGLAREESRTAKAVGEPRYSPRLPARSPRYVKDE